MGILCRFLLITGLLLCSVTAQTVHYSENFEGSIPNMTVTGGGWEFGTPTYSSGPLTVPEGNRCAGTILSGTYANNAAYILTSPSIAIPDSSIIKLSFNEWYSTQSSYDYIYLEIEQNSSGTWNSIRSSISGSNSSWNLRTYDISSYKNSNIRIRFRLTSNSSTVYAGWYLDQIKVYTPTVYPITSTATQYNFSTSYYDNSPSNGVRFKFTAPSSGSYTVNIQNVQSQTDYFYYYGRDSLFNTSLEYKTNSGTASAFISFYAANPGENYYFKVVPYTSTAYDFKISYTNALSLTLLNDSHGTTSPTGTIGVMSGESKAVSATPSSGYRFTNWSIENGSPVIGSTTSMSTTMTEEEMTTLIKDTYKYLPAIQCSRHPEWFFIEAVITTTKFC